MKKHTVNQEKLVTTLLASALIGLVVLVLELRSWMIEVEADRKVYAHKLIEFDSSIKSLNSILHSVNINLETFNKNQEMINYKLQRLTNRVHNIESK